MGPTTKDRERQTGTYPSRRALRYQQRRDQIRRRVIVIVGAAVLVAAGVFVIATSAGDDETPPTTTFTGSTLNVILGDYLIAGDLTAPAGNVRLQAINQGGVVHNVGVRRGPISGDMQPGGTFTIGLGTLVPGTYQLYCDIVGHVEQGMVADLLITES